MALDQGGRGDSSFALPLTTKLTTKQFSPLALLAGLEMPYVYISGGFTVFILHVEDLGMPSTNYLHWGAVKVWVVVSENYREKFEDVWMVSFHSHFLLECLESNLVCSRAKIKKRDCCRI